MSDLRRFVAELRRRKVMRVAGVYAVVAFVVVQVADLVVEPLQLPPWTLTFLIVLVVLGFPIALVLAWAFDITPDGVTRTGPSAPGDPSPEHRPEALWKWAAAAAGLVLLAGGALWLGTRSAPPADPGASRTVTVAVLPFADMSPEGDHRYFADGMTEELIHLLTGVEGIRPVARSSVFALQGRELDVGEMGGRLGATAVLEGSVRRFQDRLRIGAQLVDVETGHPLWADVYERRVEDVFRMQDEIARAIVDALRGHLIPRDAVAADRLEEVDLEAYDLYLRGRYFWHRRTGPSLEAAVELFERSVAIAPDFARGHVGLGDAYAILGFYEFLPPDDAFPLARRAASRALELDPSLADAHATLGYVALYYEWDWDRAEREFLRSIELDAGYSTAHGWYANHLTAMGRFGEAERAMRRAMELDPLSLIANAALGWVLYYAGAPERALAQLERSLEMDPDFELAHLWKGQALEELGRYDEARRSLERALEVGGAGDLPWIALARLEALADREDRAREILETFEARDPDSYVPSYEIARVHQALGERDQTFSWLERAREERSRSMVFLRVDPAFAELRSDPRFDRLARTVGL